MDSTVTLVKPSTTQFEFSKNSMTNTAIMSQGQPVYTISTAPTGDRTDIKDAQTKRVLATVKRRTFFSDTVTFPDHFDGKSLKLDKWLVGGQLPDGSKVKTFETSAGRYHWKIHSVHGLAMFSDVDPEVPLVYSAPRSPLTLIMDSRTAGFREQVLASFIVIEQKNRMEHKSGVVAGEAIRQDAIDTVF